MRYTLFVGGVTGSGKTTTCTKIATMMNGCVRVVHVGGIACALASANALATDSIEKASSLALDECQQLVVEHIVNMQRLAPADATFILDGHFVLGGVKRPPYRLPEWVFERLSIDMLILCAPPIAEIQSRINGDVERVRPAVVVNSLKYYSTIEIEHARLISQQCRIPLIIIERVEDIFSKLDSGEKSLTT